MSNQPSKTGTGLQPNIAGLLCYLGLWVTGLVFVLLEKEDKFVRFHAIQSIVVFGAITVITIIINFIPLIGRTIANLIWLLAAVLWIVLMVKAYQGQTYKLPIAGDIAERQVKG